LKRHASERLFKRIVIETKADNGLEQLAVVMAGLLFIIQVCHGAEGLQMMLPVTLAIEAAGHEMRPPVFLQQPAGRHVYSGSRRHQVVGVFNAAIILRAAQLPVCSHAVELEQPVFETGFDTELPRLVSHRWPVFQAIAALDPRTARRRPDLS